MFSFFLSLQSGEFFSVIKHTARVLVSLLLNLILLLVQKLSTFDLFGVLGFFDLSKERLLLVLSLLALRHKLVLLFSNCALLGFNIQLDVHFHIGVFLVLGLSVKLLFFCLQLLDFISI